MIEIVNIVASPWNPPFLKKRNRPAVRRGGHRPHDFVRLPRLTAPSQQMIEPRGSPGQKENHPEPSVISRCVLSHENPPLTTPEPPHAPRIRTRSCRSLRCSPCRRPPDFPEYIPCRRGGNHKGMQSPP